MTGGSRLFFLTSYSSEGSEFYIPLETCLMGELKAKTVTTMTVEQERFFKKAVEDSKFTVGYEGYPPYKVTIITILKDSLDHLLGSFSSHLERKNMMLCLCKQVIIPDG